MLRRLVVSTPIFVIAFAILLISVLRTASVKYEFSGVVSARGSQNSPVQKTQIPYDLAFPGKVLPDNPLWFIKVARDKIWLTTTTNESRKSELLLLFADKRLGASVFFFENGNASDGYETLIKAEQYLDQSSEQETVNSKMGIDTSEFLNRLALASLRHRQVIEEVILPIAPDDAKPQILQTLDTSKKVFEKSTQSLNEHGLTPPENPFNRG